MVRGSTTASRMKSEITHPEAKYMTTVTPVPIISAAVILVAATVFIALKFFSPNRRADRARVAVAREKRNMLTDQVMELARPAAASGFLPRRPIIRVSTK